MTSPWNYLSFVERGHSIHSIELKVFMPKVECSGLSCRSILQHTQIQQAHPFCMKGYRQNPPVQFLAS